MLIPLLVAVLTALVISELTRRVLTRLISPPVAAAAGRALGFFVAMCVAFHPKAGLFDKGLGAGLIAYLAGASVLVAFAPTVVDTLFLRGRDRSVGKRDA